MRRLKSKMKSLALNEEGNFAVLFALTIGLIGFGVAAAIEITNATNIRTKLSSSVDMAVLSAAISNAEDRKQTAQMSFDANYALKEGQSLKSLEITEPAEDRVRVEAVLSYKPIFAKILGKDTMEITAVAESNLQQAGSLDVALVLDRTGSMAGANMSNLKTAATQFLGELDNADSDVRVSVVPFSDYVNVGLENAGEAWLDLPTSSVSGTDTQCAMQDASVSTCFDPSFPPSNCQTGTTTQVMDMGAAQITTITTITENSDGSCTEEVREEVNTMGITTVLSSNVTTSSPSSRMSSNWGNVSFASSGNYCTYSSDPSDSSGSFVEECSVDHIVGNWFGCVGSRTGNRNTRVAYDGVRIPTVMELTCGQPISPLSSDVTAASARVSELTASGNTYIPAGLMWGWRSLDPSQPLQSESSEERNQLIILMTDGQNTVSQRSRFHDGNNDLQANALTAEMCAEIKDTGIKIATVSYSSGSRDGATTQMLKNCASSSDLYFEPDNASTLAQAFEDALKSAEVVRLVN